MKIIDVVIKKPLYGTYVYIRQEILDRAIKFKAGVRVTIPQGAVVIDPAEWKKNGKRMAKVFKFPNDPMILYGNFLQIKGLKTYEPQEKVEPQNKLF